MSLKKMKFITTDKASVKGGERQKESVLWQTKS